MLTNILARVMMATDCAGATDSALRELMALAGIESTFVNFSGETVAIPLADQRAVLSAMDVDVNNPTAALTALRAQQENTLLAAIHVVTRRDTAMHYELPIHLTANQRHHDLSWRLCTEQGDCAAWTRVAAAALTSVGHHGVTEHCVLPLSLQSVPEGYHRVEVQLHDGQRLVQHAHTVLVIAPARCYQADWTRSGKKLWGFSVQLYSLHSQRCWGMGDFADLQDLIRSAAQQGAGFLVLNPLHAGPLHAPQHCSPYSPIDRRWLNPLYIAPELEPEFEASGMPGWLATDTYARHWLAAAGTRDWINYTAVTALKLPVLQRMFDYLEALPAEHPRRTSLQGFIDAGGQCLQDYAHWQAGHTPTAAVELSPNPRFYCYLQWLADSQLAACQTLATSVGMVAGLVRDLAVGSDRNGSEVSSANDSFCRTASIGAPPDPLAPQGQNWGLPPLNPLVLRQRAYAHMIDLLRRNMSHCGALRMDHVMSLMRLWWCPEQGSGQGAYVRYNDEELFALLRLESQRQQCVIIGEDLGIVPETVRKHLDDSGIYSNLLFYFEKSSAHSWRAPEHYRHRALAMLANHDVPTLAAWWNAEDLQMRRALGLIAQDHELASALAERRHDKHLVLQLLESQWLLPANRFASQAQAEPEDAALDHALVAALIRVLARCNAQLVSLQLEDLALITTPVNIPGTSTEYNNWQRKLPQDLHTLLDQPPYTNLLAGARAERG